MAARTRGELLLTAAVAFHDPNILSPAGRRGIDNPSVRCPDKAVPALELSRGGLFGMSSVAIGCSPYICSRVVVHGNQDLGISGKTSAGISVQVICDLVTFTARVRNEP